VSSENEMHPHLSVSRDKQWAASDAKYGESLGRWLTVYGSRVKQLEIGAGYDVSLVGGAQMNDELASSSLQDRFAMALKRLPAADAPDQRWLGSFPNGVCIEGLGHVASKSLLDNSADPGYAKQTQPGWNPRYRR
jgi:hypothetical protein